MPITNTNERPLSTPTATSAETDGLTTASRTPSDPFMAAYDRDLGPRSTEYMNGLTSAFGPHAISRRNLTDRTFSFAEGTAFGLRLEEQAYEAKDPYVQACPVRRAVAENLRIAGGGRKVVFVESAGLTEFGGGFNATMPLEAFNYGGIGLGYGFTVSSLMRYRASTPRVLGFGERPESNFKDDKLSFPRSASAASKMVPGSEVELTGQGRVLVNAGVSGRVGLGVARVATAGIGVVVNGTVTAENETSLNVLALDKPEMVRVTIRNLDEETAGILMRIRAGLIFSVGTVVNNVAGGILRPYIEKLGAPNFEEFVNLYTTLYATFSARTAHRGLTIGSWDLDLTQPEGREAYDSLIKLDTVRAEELAHSGSTAVTDVHAKENEFEFKFGADVGMLGQKLFIYESLKIEREGRLSATSGKKLIYRDSLYTRRKKNFVTGSKEINWEAVSIKRGDHGESEPYLRVHFEQKDWDFGTDRINKMLRFADALKIPNAEIVGTDEKRFKVATDRLKKMAEVGLSTDIYFTKSGIENIDRADANAAKDAYFTMSSTIREKYKGVNFAAKDEKTKAALAIIGEYHSYKGILNIKKAGERLKVMPQIRADYLKLTGRKIDKDAQLVKQAEEFGEAVERLTDTRDAAQVSSFFLRLGKQKGFDYVQTVAALAHIAGDKETLVNNLAITGGGVTIKNTSEGGLTNPRDMVTAELYRVADASPTL